MIVFGDDYAWIGPRVGGGDGGGVAVVIHKKASRGAAERDAAWVHPKSDAMFLRVTVSEGGKCRFSYSDDGRTFITVGEEFTATAGRWVGAKVGVFAATVKGSHSGAFAGLGNGYADFDWFRVTVP